MNTDINTCKECKSAYYTDVSEKKNLCATCAHYLYGKERCYHRFEGGERCAKCYWDGTFSERIKGIIKRNNKKLKSINISIFMATVVLVISTPLTVIGIIYIDTTLLSLAEYSFSRNVLLLLSVFGVLVSIPFLRKAKAHKKQLIKENPYLDSY
ncbi:hypothetical protein KORDIASMS9_00108 [Kordia sp. SMS9]|uniref:hypothetical protein n=1 Tax=Kordia sp. SMS9 TaxID=2282170 RepID=UPI000E10053C|nr:hypothetical protein [Kordia sp. SMS9]AXG67926.1 hypothetical protein KORDIASMS9_00108 [Kordia sp. SMS9]